MNFDSLKELPDAPLVAIVDDDASARNSARRLLRSSGFHAEAFASAEEFLNSEALARTACLVLDVRMPGMTGLDLQRHLMEMGQGIPIVFLSARASEEEERRGMHAGASAFLHKPARKEVLLDAIRAAMVR